MKKFLKIFFIAVILFPVFTKVYSQDTSKIISVKSAFELNYLFDKAGHHQIAIDKLLEVYDAKSYEINLRLGFLYYVSALYRQSASYYKIAVNLKPNSIEAKLGYALPLAALASWDTLKIQYEDILKLDPNNSKVNFRMGLIYYYKSDYNTAAIYFDKVYNSFPFDYDNTLMYAWTEYKLNKNMEAKNLFNIVLLIMPNDPSSLEGLSLLK